MKVENININKFSKEQIEELKAKHGDKAFTAAKEHILRQRRDTHPEGTFDSGGRFYLSEHCNCCAGIRTPSRAHPFNHMIHGRTITHCSELYGVSEQAGKDALRGFKRIMKGIEAEAEATA